jgi:hypothetical protein
MIVKDLSKDILYIENVFERAQDFVDAIERFDSDTQVHPVIPAWRDWYDGVPYQDEDGVWQVNYHDAPKGKQKLFDWNISATNNYRVWPLPEDDLGDYAHKIANPVIHLIHEPYLKVLDIWYEKTGHKKLDYVSKNYTLKKYNTGGSIGTHIDKNDQDPGSTMDYTVLFYLTDNYEGGEIEFTEANITLKPAAGSALIFKTTEPHMAYEVREGDKYFIFMYIHTEFGHSTSLYEDFVALNNSISEYRKNLNS